MARAAATGGGRTYRGQAPINWYLSLVVICVLGLISVAYSRYELQHPSSSSASKAAPAVGTHWYEAVGFDICGKVEPNLPQNPPSGPKASTPQIFTAGDGLIHVSPTTSAYAGANATLGRFVSGYKGLELTATTLRYPGSPTYSNGKRCPKGTPDAGKPGKVQVRVWSSPTSSSSTLVKGNPGSLHLQDGQMITIAFLPKGAPLPKPPALDITTLLKTLAGTSASSSTSLPSTGVSVPSTGVSVPSTGVSVPSTGVSVPSTGVSVPSTATSAPSTATSAPSTATSAPASSGSPSKSSPPAKGTSSSGK